MIPKHVAIIMDGNGRWATNKCLPRYLGHREGMSSLKRIVKYCSNQGIDTLTVYAFSTENWNRPSEEVDYLMKLMEYMFSKEIDELNQNGVCIKMIGDTSMLGSAQKRIWQEAETKTCKNDQLRFNIAFNYGGRNEITNAAKALAQDVLAGDVTIENITEDVFAKYLYTSGIADPDLIIRTGGEYRISNFLLWQAAYTEWFFTDTLWPDFGIDDFKKALVVYAERERRFGQVSNYSR